MVFKRQEDGSLAKTLNLCLRVEGITKLMAVITETNKTCTLLTVVNDLPFRTLLTIKSCLSSFLSLHISFHLL